MSNTNLSTPKTDYTQPELRNRLKFKQLPSNNHIISLLFAMTLLLLYFKAEATTSDNSTQNDIAYTIKYDENFNPVVCGIISNNKGKAITSVEITMQYLECGNDNGWKQTKVAHVFINSGEQGSFQ